jgi:uncharacterized damage-inducible protein DinB
MVLKPDHYAPNAYFKSIIEEIPEEDLISALVNSRLETIDLIQSIPSKKESYAYAEEKWNVKQLFQHVIDCERIFNFRALSLARRESQKFSGFDDQAYVDYDCTERISLNRIGEDYAISRLSTISLMESIQPEILDFEGNANGITVTPRIVGWFIAGHNYHHNKIIRERYL